MAKENFSAVAVGAVSLRAAPRTIILPGRVSQALRGAALGSANDAQHLERGGAVFARANGELFVRRTEVSNVTASKDTMTVDRSALRKSDRLLSEFHTHPRGGTEPDFELSDPPSHTDYDHFARQADRMLLVTTKTMTYGLLKTTEYDKWWASLPKDPANGQPFYQQQLSFAYGIYRSAAQAQHRSFARAIAIAAMRVAREFYIAFYVGSATTLQRIDDKWEERLGKKRSR